jgi:hypothetical protein
MSEAELDVRIPEMWITELPKMYCVSVKIVGRRPSGKFGVRDLVEWGVRKTSRRSSVRSRRSLG